MQAEDGLHLEASEPGSHSVPTANRADSMSLAYYLELASRDDAVSEPSAICAAALVFVRAASW